MSFIKNVALATALALVGFACHQTVHAQSDVKEVKPIVEGDQAADFELQSLGKKIKLSDNFGEEGKPVVLVFSRANW